METESARCAECETRLAEGQDRVETEDGVFCRPCFNNLTAQLQRAVAAQSENVNYSMAAIGGLLGGALGVLVWWGFTVLTNIAFGLIAVLIGIAVGKGIVILSGQKRAAGLQVMSVVIAAIAFFYAKYLVTRTFLIQAYEEAGQAILLPWLPEPGLFVEVVRAGFGFMDVVFLAIVVYEAWKIPAPFRVSR